MTKPEPPFALTPGERSNPLWQKLFAHFEKQLQSLRCQNDMPRTELETATIRGKISFCKELLSLAKELPPIDGQL